MKKLLAAAIALGTFVAASNLAHAGGGGFRIHYGGGKHTSSHGGHYLGGSGSSHKGGSYRNYMTGNSYGTHR